MLIRLTSARSALLCLLTFTLCPSILTHCLLHTHLCPLDAPAVPPVPYATVAFQYSLLASCIPISAHCMPLRCLLCLVAAQFLTPSGCQLLVCISACRIKTQLEGMALGVLYLA